MLPEQAMTDDYPAFDRDACQMIDTLRDMVRERDAEIKRLEQDLRKTQANHAKLARGIKKFLGLDQWPRTMPGKFQDAVINLLMQTKKTHDD